MKPVMALAATAQSLSNRRAIVGRVRRPDRAFGRKRWLPGFSVALLGWQAALLFALFGEAIELGAYAAVHFGGCFALAFLFWRLHVSTGDDRHSTALQIVAWSALAGPFGALTGAALLLPSPVLAGTSRESVTDDTTADTAPIGHAERMHIALLDRRLRIEGACLIDPLIDVIAEGSQAEKLETLGVVYRKYEARLSAVLRCALRDSDASVRVLAATVLAKLHTQFTGKVGECHTAAAQEPKHAQNWRDLAAARLAYIDSGLLEASRVRAQRELAAGDLSRAIELDPADHASAGRLDMIRLQLQPLPGLPRHQSILDQAEDHDRAC